MPEGDTIWKTAATLRRALAGRPLVAFEATVPLRRHPSLGVPIRGVEARGKHLLIRFGDATVLHTHMRMHGSWHVYPGGARWHRDPVAMRVAIRTPDTQAVCFAAPVVEMLTVAEVERHPRLRALGPDLAAPDPDVAAAAARLATRRGVEVGVALLDQRVAAGIGNVYKSEALFACRVNPFAHADTLTDRARTALVATAASLLRANVRRAGPRSTLPRGRLAVYGRAGLPCPRCGERIASARQGEQARVTYWCPRCQPATRTHPARR